MNTILDSRLEALLGTRFEELPGDMSSFVFLLFSFPVFLIILFPQSSTRSPSHPAT